MGSTYTVAPALEAMQRDDDAPSAMAVQALAMNLLTLNGSVGAAKTTQAHNDGARGKVLLPVLFVGRASKWTRCRQVHGEESFVAIPCWGIALDTDGHSR
jgi:hypothetical protein